MSVAQLRVEFGAVRMETFETIAVELVADGLLRKDAARLMLTERGRMISNEVFGELLRIAV